MSISGIGMNGGYLQSLQQQRPTQQAQNVGAVKAVEAIKAGQSKTATAQAVKAPRYDKVEIDAQGYDAYLRQSKASQDSVAEMQQQAVKKNPQQLQQTQQTQAVSMLMPSQQ